MSEVEAEEWITLLLKPVLLVAFTLLHIVYHLVLVCADAWHRVQRPTVEQPPEASWPNMLAQCGFGEQDVKVPQHLAVVLVDTPPSPWRLALYSLFRGTRATIAQFQQKRYEAVQLKHAHDLATLVHLCQQSGVEQLTVYTPQVLTTTEQMQVILLQRYGTKAVLRQNTTHLRHDTSKKSPSSSTSSSRSSSDTEASVSSTLASSYTVDAHQRSVDLYMNHSAMSDNGRLRVLLLSESDQFAHLASMYVLQSGHDYLAQLQPDLAKGGSPSSLRRQWEPLRSAHVANLTADRLDRHLMEHGYVPEPQLLIVYGGNVRCRQLHGIPAWPMRVTDLFFDADMQAHLPYSWRDFVGAVRKHANVEQRYGR